MTIKELYMYARKHGLQNATLRVERKYQDIKNDLDGTYLIEVTEKDLECRHVNMLGGKADVCAVIKQRGDLARKV